jgi:hypothetical protein
MVGSFSGHGFWLVRSMMVAGALYGCVVGLRAQETTKLINPFPTAAPKIESMAKSNPDLDALEFTGVSSILDQRSFNFTDKRTRKSFWVPLHGTANDFTVVSYDEKAEQIVVRRGQHSRTIDLRKPRLIVTPAAPMVAHTNNPPASTAMPANATPGSGVDELRNPQTPEEIKQAEYEARMMVSDLLDISMQERARQKALRDAERAAKARPANKR